LNIMKNHYRLILPLIVVLIPVLIGSGCSQTLPDNACPIPADGSSPNCDTVIVNGVSQPVTPAGASGKPSLGDMIPRITVEQLGKELQNKQDVLIIDTRVDVDPQYATGHIRGAIPVPLANMLEGWAPSVSLDKEVVLYCT
jgi:hypothetical protein